MPDDVGEVDVEMFQVDRDVEAVVVCGCHGWAFETYADFYRHTDGDFPTIVEAEDAAFVASREATYREWARDQEIDALVVAEVREAEGGGYTIDVPASVGAKTMRTSYVRGYESFVDGEPRDSNPYDPDSPAYDGWSGFVRARQKRWWRGWDDAEERLGGKSWVESRRERLDEDGVEG